jgi:hypothetical protein
LDRGRKDSGAVLSAGLGEGDRAAEQRENDKLPAKTF